MLSRRLQVWIRSESRLPPSLPFPHLSASLCDCSYLTRLCSCLLGQRKGTIAFLMWLEGRVNENTIRAQGCRGW